MADFTTLGVNHKIVSALSALGVTHPTFIQSETIPKLLGESTDFVGQAATGTGKTYAFAIPLLHHMEAGGKHPQALILVPTRELGHQVVDAVKSLANALEKVTVCAAIGGSSVKESVKELKQPTDILVATPGRLLDLLERGAVSLSDLKCLVLDEADEMLNQGFEEDLGKIKEKIPASIMTWLFSATISSDVSRLVEGVLKKGYQQVVTTEKDKGTTNHYFMVVDPIDKLETLIYFVNKFPNQKGIIFCRTKAGVNKLQKQLVINGYTVGAVHGDLPQGLRDKVMEQYRNGYIDLLIASDVLARGIDVEGVAYVVNYQIPDKTEFYVHRTGRTGRAGKAGIALSILFEEEKEVFKDITKPLSIAFDQYKKPTAKDFQENRVKLWAQRIKKIKPMVDPAFLKEIGKQFDGMSKEVLLEKLVTAELIGVLPHEIKGKK